MLYYVWQQFLYAAAHESGVGASLAASPWATVVQVDIVMY
jgi:hypothetical protein